MIETFNSCNNLEGAASKPPFPTYEIVNYVLIAVGALVFLGFAMYKLRPYTHIRFIRQLNELRSDILSGEAPPRDFESILGCSRAKGDVWPLLSTILVGLLLIATIMLTVSMMRSSSMYEMGLYASGLFSKGRCTRGKRRGD